LEERARFGENKNGLLLGNCSAQDLFRFVVQWQSLVSAMLKL